jgi:hypothetical protein
MQHDDRRREIYLAETTTVVELEPRMDVSAAALVKAGFEELGLLLTIHDRLAFEQARELVAHFGFIARRASPPPRA